MMENNNNILEKMDVHHKAIRDEHEELGFRIDNMREELVTFNTTVVKRLEELQKISRSLEKRVSDVEDIEVIVKELRMKWNDYLAQQGIAHRHFSMKGNGG